jgi:hypothetical protein
MKASEHDYFGTTMNWFERFYWTRLSKPATERNLWRFLLTNPVASVLQLGMHDGSQTLRLLRFVRQTSPSTTLRFAGVDMFEAADDRSKHLKLKEAHRLCAELGIKAHLIPGELRTALPRVAITILPSDLVLINQPIDPNSKDGEAIKQWMPRLIHPSSTVMACEAASGKLVQVNFQAASQSRQAA